MWLIIVVATIGSVALFLSNPAQALSQLASMTPYQWMIVCIPLLFTMLLTLASRLGGPFRQSLPQLTAWLSAHQRCGVCACDLSKSSADDDGLVTCPECGSAWHPDRWTLKSDNIAASDLTLDVMMGANGSSFEWCTDDRGVPLDLRGFSIMKWSNQPRASTKMAARLLRQVAFERKRRLRRVFPVTILGWLVFNVAIFIIRNPAPRDRVFDIALVGVVTALIAAVVLYIARRGNVNPRRFRAALLSHHVCANCGGELDEFPAPSFDGCTACAHCGRAWNLSEFEPITPSAPASPPSPA
ncbi:MAG: hypothetical protein IT434_15250 [Phycisphaerales bacterium]|nr:hypothetical protein [Phycisphaerales bacterium]